MIARLDEKLTAQMNEIMHAPGVPATRERLARAALPRLQFGDRRDAEDPRHERRQERAVPQLEALSGRALGPKPAVQEDLRSRVRPARRRALRRAGRRLSFQPVADSTCSCCATYRRSPRPRSRRSSPARIPTLLGMDSWNELMNPRDIGKLIDTPDYAAWKGLRDSVDAAMSRSACRACFPACPTARSPNRSRSSPSRRTPTATRARNTAG